MGALYPGQEPLSFGPIIQYERGGPDPLEATSVYRSQSGVPHWQYVTFGFSELHDKVSPDTALSGFGFELTLRLAADPDQAGPPRWPVDLLQSLARYVFVTGNGFDAGHHMDLDGPLVADLETRISAIALREDPELPAMETVNGRVTFLQVVGLTADELEAVRAWDPIPFLDLLEREIPLLVLDPTRASVLEGSELRAAVEQLTTQDGSSQEAAFVASLEWSCDGDSVEITLDAVSVGDLLRLLRGRTLHQRNFLLVRGEEQVVEFMAGGDFAWTVDESEPLVTLEVSEQLAREMLHTLRPTPEIYSWDAAPGLRLHVVS